MDGENAFLRYDQVWQRVAPALEPYPAAGPETDGDARRRPGPRPRPEETPTWKPEENKRPGPGWKPCPPFRGADSPETLADFIQEEQMEQRQYQALEKTAPMWARQSLRNLAARCAAHARQLMAAYYLTTGERYSPAVSLGEIFPGPWGPSLRERYQSRVCAGLRYAQAAERAADPCMERLFEDLSGEAYKGAADLLRLLERGTGS